MEPWKRILLVILVTLTILSLLLSACGPIDKNDNRKDNDKDKNKDKENNEDDNKLNGNGDQNNGPKVDKILICHKTGSAKNPYVPISVSENALKNGHGKHAGDIIPAPVGGCPESWITTDVPAK